jgi:hypothetical protein
MDHLTDYNNKPGPIPKALQVGPNSLLTALARCKRNHVAVQAAAKEAVEKRAFQKQIRQMEEADKKAAKKAKKAHAKMEKHREKAKAKGGSFQTYTKGKTIKVKEVPDSKDFEAARQVYDKGKGKGKG